MRINVKLLGLTGALSALVWLVQTTGCTGGDDSASGGADSSTAGTGTGTAGATGASAGAGTGGGAALTGVCASPTVIPAAKPGIADFEDYTGDNTDFQKWSFLLGGDSVLGVREGTFSYGDRDTGLPEISEFSAGHDSMYAMRIADTMLDRTPGTTGLYGGGMGLWQSVCINATAFTGISFWVRGSSPSPTATLTVSMGETTPATPATAKSGTCSGTSTTCVHPTFAFALAADATTWTQIKAPWASFTAGSAAGTAVMPDGRNITQLQFGVGLVFVAPDGSTDYAAVPAAYELVVDDLTFY